MGVIRVGDHGSARATWRAGGGQPGLGSGLNSILLMPVAIQKPIFSPYLLFQGFR